MPILDTERRRSSRSALRYRPIDQVATGPVVTRARSSRPEARVVSGPIILDEPARDDEVQSPRRRRTMPSAPRQPVVPVQSRQHFHPLFFVGLGLLLTLLLWAGITQVMALGSNELNTLKFGYPRTFQTDVAVGHNDNAQHPSHFVALNLHGQILVIELPGSDPAKAREFVITTILGQEADLVPVTLRFLDLNKNGRPDMVIDIGGMPQSVLINAQGTFRLPEPAEEQQLLQELQQS